MMTPGRLWWLISRDCQRGWSASWHARFTAGRILKHKTPAPERIENAVPVHVLTGKETWLLTAWMLASWEHATGRKWNIVLHEDGTLTEEMSKLLAGLFPGLTMIWKRDADRQIELELKGMPHCLEYRSRHPLAQKIFDVPLLCRSERFVLLDSDVLFFRRPDRVLAWVDDGKEECYFNEDVGEASVVAADQALECFNIRLWPRVNSGLCLVYRQAIEPGFCEQCMARTGMLQGVLWRVEQTLFALCASRHGRGGVLPREYEVSLGRFARPGVVARHYVGAVRDRFYGEGMARLKHELLAAV